MLVVLDPFAPGHHLQVVNPPITRISPHLGKQLRRVRHDLMVSPAVPDRAGLLCSRAFFDCTPQAPVRKIEDLNARVSMRKGGLIAICLVGAYLLFPQKELVCPAWTVSVVDTTQTPVDGMTVRRTCQDYSVELVEHEDDAITDAQGRVVFREIRIQTTRLRRWTGNLLNVVSQGVHASFGLHAAVFAFGRGIEGSAVSNGLVEDWTGFPRRMESTIVVEPVRVPSTKPSK